MNKIIISPKKDRKPLQNCFMTFLRFYWHFRGNSWLEYKNIKLLAQQNFYPRAF